MGGSTGVKGRLINLGGRDISYTIRYSKRTSKLRLSISTDAGLEIIIPEGLRIGSVEPYIKSQEKWILDKLSRYSRPDQDWRQNCFPKGQHTLFLGREYDLIKIIRKGAQPEVRLDNNNMFITMPDGSTETLTRILENWYRQNAREIFTERVKVINREMNLDYNRIFIRNQKTRWGSCSGLKNLSFNWRLVMAPIQIIDYLVAHELSHILEMNHSKKFWQIVETVCPDYRIHRKWLKENGSNLSL